MYYLINSSSSSLHNSFLLCNRSLQIITLRNFYTLQFWLLSISLLVLQLTILLVQLCILLRMLVYLNFINFVYIFFNVLTYRLYSKSNFVKLPQKLFDVLMYYLTIFSSFSLLYLFLINNYN